MAGLNDFIRRLERLAAADVQHRIAQKVASAAHDECLRGFVEERNPYGVPWAPRKAGGWAALAFGKLDDGHKLLDDTGRGINSLISRAVGSRAVMRMIGYMKFHQTGTSNMVDRKMFPDPAIGLGTWREPIRAASVAAVKELVEGGR